MKRPSKSQAKTRAASPARSVRRAKIATAVVTGKTLAQAAREAGLSRQWASHEAQQPETALLLAGMLAPHQARIQALVGRSIEAIDDALAAEKVALDREGNKAALGPDHYARLQAVKRLVEILEAARPRGSAEQGGEEGLLLMDRLHAVFRQESHARPR
ncbi:MAG: hypothetical protein FJW34_00140 [Acidobacteria bacterium]|nr:hypothetical protein [Acidobacteriota bacterium]